MPSCTSLDLVHVFARYGSLLQNSLSSKGKVLRKYLKWISFFVTKKRDSGSGVFCEFCAISKNIFFTKHFWATASDMSMNPTLFFLYEIGL